MKERINVRVNATPEYAQAVAKNADQWVAACGGLEQPFDHDGRTYLYVFNPATHKHGYLDMGTDIVQEDIPF